MIDCFIEILLCFNARMKKSILIRKRTSQPLLDVKHNMVRIKMDNIVPFSFFEKLNSLFGKRMKNPTIAVAKDINIA